MTEYDDYPTDIPATPLLVDDATELEPSSPGGSIRGLYVRSRPTSMDGPIADFPRATFDGADLDLAFAQFGMTAAAATAISPMAPVFPPIAPVVPILRMPPPPKRRRYALSVRTLNVGASNNATAVPALRTVRREPAVIEPSSPSELGQEVKPVSGWKKLKKLVPGLFPRPNAATERAPIMPLGDLNGGTQTAGSSSNPTISPSTASSSKRGRALSIRSFKSTKSKAKARGVENVPPPLPARPRSRLHSFSGYLADTELADGEDDDDEADALQREALRITALMFREEYAFAHVDADGNPIGVAM
ncbi:hypothetical protein C8R46DRAFT_1026742 [Mycena filopes]|nr:hypothetical protein C8R46DRAFT_1026742 [Mycena filopes]